MHRKDDSKLPNVLLIILDSIRAENTSLYGYSKDTTPFLRRFSQSATLYTEARAPSTNTMMSLASMFTGLHVPEHNLTHRGLCLRSGHTVWEKLTQAGYETSVFSRNSNIVDLSIGLGQAFNEVFSGRERRPPFQSAIDPSKHYSEQGVNISQFIYKSVKNRTPLRSVANAIAVALDNRNLDAVIPDGMSAKYNDSIHTKQALEWIEAQEGPWAACINYMDAHIPYQPRKQHNLFTENLNPTDGDSGKSKWEFYNGNRSFDEIRELEGLYDGAIHQVDSEVEKLIRGLRECDEHENTIIIIAGDHGDTFGEVSKVRDSECVHHGITARIHESITHIPLLIKSPGQVSGEVISELATLTCFSDVIDSIIKRNQVADDFIPDSRVIAYSPGISQFERAEAEKYNIKNFSSFQKPMKVVYQHSSTGTGISRYIQWKSKVYIDSLDQNESHKTIQEKSERDSSIIATTFDNLRDQNVVYGTDAGVDPQVRKRLRELGYA